MTWDKLAPLYDLFEYIYNGKVNRQLVIDIKKYVAQSDDVLECACGTGMLSVPIAEKCRRLYATDYSVGMLKQAKKKLKKFENVKLAKADITKLACGDNRFDKIVAANVIHLLDEPGSAINELLRVCKPGGFVIIPTYVNKQKKEADIMAKILQTMGVDFKKQYDYNSYKKFFHDIGYDNVEYRLIDGKMPSAIAIIKKPVM